MDDGAKETLRFRAAVVQAKGSPDGRYVRTYDGVTITVYDPDRAPTLSEVLSKKR